MKDLNQIINGLTKSGLLSGLAGGLAGGTLAGALTSKKGRKMGKSVLKVGALAAVGGVAWKAYQAYSQRSHSPHNAQHPANPQAAPRPAGARFETTPAAIPQERFEAVAADVPDNPGQMLLLRAMISAAYADGHIDHAEKQRIFDQVEQMDLSTEDKALLFDELRHPMALNTLVRLIPDRETGIEVYAAALLAIDQSQAASIGYLRQLAGSLQLPDELVQSLHEEVATAKAGYNASVA